MKNYLFLLIFIIFCINVSGQITFEKTYDSGGSSQGYCVIQSDDNGYLIGGRTYQDLTFGYVVKTDSLGNTEWTKVYFGLTTFYCAINDYNNTYTLLNENNSSTSIIRIDSVGNMIWYKNLQGFSGHNFVHLADSGYIIAGRKYIGPGDYDIFITKVSSSGDSLWTKLYGTNNYEDVADFILTRDNKLVLVGLSEYEGENRIHVMKTDLNGDTIWTNHYQSGNAHKICESDDSGYFIIGYENGIGHIAMKIDTAGAQLWQVDLNLLNSNLTTSGNNEYIIAGNSNGSCVRKLDSVGNTVWNKYYADQFNTTLAQNCIRTNDNGIAVVGYTYFGGQDIFMIKTDADGCIKPNINYFFGSNDVTVNDTILYQIETTFRDDSISFSWQSNYGNLVTGEQNDSMRVIWNQIGIDTLIIVATNACGSDSIVMPINIAECVNPLINSISGNNVVGLGNEYTYSIDLLEGTDTVFFNWVLSNGTIVCGQNTTEIVAIFEDPGNVLIEVTATNQCGTDTSYSSFSIYVNNATNSEMGYIKVFPNPFSDFIDIVFEKHSTYEIIIHDLLGNEVLTETFTGSKYSLITTGLTEGTYVLQLKSDKGIRVEKIVKQ